MKSSINQQTTNSLTSKQILQEFLDFYKARGHKQVPNVSVLPEGDSTLLFVNSGMFPLVPYLMGEPHPLGKRLTNVQRSIRFQDIEEVGLDIRHTTAFHMLGNWSLGDYFKKEQLPWVYEFFVEVLGLDPNRLYATVFAGDDNIPKDEESIAILKDIFAKYKIDAKLGERIFAFGRKSNWWQRGDDIGELGGPDSEIFYWLGDTPPKPGQNPETEEDLFLEIGNSVFMQYIKTANGWKPLKQKNVDFGGGLERIAMVVQGKNDIFLTDMFYPIISTIENLTGKKYQDYKYEMRVIADHMRAATILAMDGVFPSNKDQGYVLRRLIRRMIRMSWRLGVSDALSPTLLDPTINMLNWLYPWWNDRKDQVAKLFLEEEERFLATISRVIPKVKNMLQKFKNANFQSDTDLSVSNKVNIASHSVKSVQSSSIRQNQNAQKSDNHGDLQDKSPAKMSANIATLAKMAFDLYQSDGYPADLFYEELKDHSINIDQDQFNEEFNKLFNQHKKISRKGVKEKFKGGLASHSEITKKYHTATHLLHAALTDILGNFIYQKGSNITDQRLRFDFPYDKALTDDQIKMIEDWVNDKIDEDLPVDFKVMSFDDAIKLGAKHIPGQQYPSQVKVYYIGPSLQKAVSIELCGGPHVTKTSEIPHIKIYKQESVGKGVRRIYAHFV